MSPSELLWLKLAKSSVCGMQRPAPLLLLLTTSIPATAPESTSLLSRGFFDWPAAVEDLVGGGALVVRELVGRVE